MNPRPAWRACVKIPENKYNKIMKAAPLQLMRESRGGSTAWHLGVTEPDALPGTE